MCIVYCVMCIVFCVLHIEYCVMCCCVRYNVYCVLCDVYCVHCDVCCVMCTVYCVMCTVYCVLCTIYCPKCLNLQLVVFFALQSSVRKWTADTIWPLVPLGNTSWNLPKHPVCSLQQICILYLNINSALVEIIFLPCRMYGLSSRDHQTNFYVLTESFEILIFFWVKSLGNYLRLS